MSPSWWTCFVWSLFLTVVCAVNDASICLQLQANFSVSIFALGLTATHKHILLLTNTGDGFSFVRQAKTSEPITALRLGTAEQFRITDRWPGLILPAEDTTIGFFASGKVYENYEPPYGELLYDYDDFFWIERQNSSTVELGRYLLKSDQTQHRITPKRYHARLVPISSITSPEILVLGCNSAGGMEFLYAYRFFTGHMSKKAGQLRLDQSHIVLKPAVDYCAFDLGFADERFVYLVNSGHKKVTVFGGIKPGERKHDPDRPVEALKELPLSQFLDCRLPKKPTEIVEEVNETTAKSGTTSSPDDDNIILILILAILALVVVLFLLLAAYILWMRYMSSTAKWRTTMNSRSSVSSINGGGGRGRKAAGSSLSWFASTLGSRSSASRGLSVNRSSVSSAGGGKPKKSPIFNKDGRSSNKEF